LFSGDSITIYDGNKIIKKVIIYDKEYPDSFDRVVKKIKELAPKYNNL
jgi:hypothetical protein